MERAREEKGQKQPRGKMLGRSRVSGGETGLKKKEGGEEENSRGEEREAKKEKG